MGLVGQNRPVKIARRVIEVNKLSIPFDLENLVKKYAKLIYKHIPIAGVDGVTVNLKVPGKIPTIIVNTNRPKSRQRFTLAHELGHVIIPWHTGTIIDDIYFSQDVLDFSYWYLEQEANSFAAELLMPGEWIDKMYEKYGDNLQKLHLKVATTANVSDLAAAIRLVQTLPPEIVFIAVEEGEIINVGKTPLSTAPIPLRGDDFNEDFYSHFKHKSVYHSGSILYFWYNLNAEIELSIIDDSRSWREILDKIANDIILIDKESFKKSINGIVAAAHSTVKRNNPNYTIGFLSLALTNRLRREDLQDFVNHKDFEIFVQKRAFDFYNGIKKK